MFSVSMIHRFRKSNVARCLTSLFYDIDIDCISLKFLKASFLHQPRHYFYTFFEFPILY